MGLAVAIAADFSSFFSFSSSSLLFLRYYDREQLPGRRLWYIHALADHMPTWTKAPAFGKRQDVHTTWVPTHVERTAQQRAVRVDCSRCTFLADAQKRRQRSGSGSGAGKGLVATRKVEMGTVTCDQCHAAFCRECWRVVHAKPKRRAASKGKEAAAAQYKRANHTFTVIPRCGHCKYYAGTKYCAECKLVFCDTCYLHSHEEIADRAFGRRHEPRPAEHAIDQLVVPCAECDGFWEGGYAKGFAWAARWQCWQCGDKTCSACCARVHAKGNRRHHDVSALPE